MDLNWMPCVNRPSGLNVGLSAHCRRKTKRCRRSHFDPQATWALPLEAEHWSLTTLRKKLIKIGAKVVRHGRYVTFQLAEVAVLRELFRKILRLIDGLRPAPLPP